MHSTTALEKQSILDDLVNQFTDPLSFFRELIQNAVDAGTGEVDIRVAFEADDDERGTMIIHVDDFGEGMTREIIETKLTRLFSSAKDDDFTKIGRFGIGFVSVFAIEPEAVCVDTGRTGENWRMLFSADKTYELYELDRPIEGTQIRIYKGTTRAEFDELEARARQVIMRWCKHVPVPIFFQGEELAAPFDVDSPCKIVHREQGTRLVMGFVAEPNAPFGYYNQGLTLKEGAESPWPHISFKIDSRYLEHTLTRDQILEDRHFHKAWGLLEEIADKKLPAKLVDRIEEAADGPRENYPELCARLTDWLRTGGKLRWGWTRRSLVATVDGEAVSLRECEMRGDAGQLLCAPTRSALTDALSDDYLVIKSSPSDAVRHLILEAADHKPVPATHGFVLASGARRAPSSGAEKLGEEVSELLRHIGGAVEWVGFDGLEGGCANLVALLLEDRHRLYNIEELPACTLESLRAAYQVVINTAHKQVRPLLEVAEREPEWAALVLFKLLVRREAPDPALYEVLIDRSITRRRARLGGQR